MQLNSAIKAPERQGMAVSSRHDLLILGLLIAFALLILSFAWVGYLDSDDKVHFGGGIGWFEHFPFIGQNHGEMRHFVVIPMAISFALLGVSDFSIAVPNALYFLGLLVVTFYGVRYAVDRSTAIIATLLVTLVPLFAIRATVAYSDTTEMFFVVCSFFLFYGAVARPNPVRYLVAAGVMAGCAWLTRETTAALLLFYGILFLAGYRYARGKYWIMAGGFLAVILFEMAFMYWAGTSPLHRYLMTYNEIAPHTPHGKIAGEIFDTIGNVQVNPYIDPIILLLINHEFSILYYVAIPGLAAMLVSKKMPKEKKDFAKLVIGAAFVWFMVAMYVDLEYRHPRYLSVTTYFVMIALAVFFRHYLWPLKPRFAWLLAAGIACADIAAIYVDNRNPLADEHALVEFAKGTHETVYTDLQTLRRGKFLLDVHGLAGRVSADLPVPAGALYFWDPHRLNEGQKIHPGIARIYARQPDWRMVWRYEEPRRFVGRIIEFLGLAHAMPPEIYRRLNNPNQPVAVFRIGAKPIRGVAPK